MWSNSVANFCSRSESPNQLIVVPLGIGNAGLIFEVLAASAAVSGQTEVLFFKGLRCWFRCYTNRGRNVGTASWKLDTILLEYMTR